MHDSLTFGDNTLASERRPHVVAGDHYAIELHRLYSRHTLLPQSYVISTGGGAFAAVAERPLYLSVIGLATTQSEDTGVSPLRFASVEMTCGWGWVRFGRDDAKS